MENMEDALGTTIEIQNKQYRIASILTKNETVLNMITDNNIYVDSLNKSIVLCDYEESLSLNHEEKDTESYMISMDLNKDSPQLEEVADSFGLPLLTVLQENISSIS